MKIYFITLFIFALSACGGGSSKSTNVPAPAPIITPPPVEIVPEPTLEITGVYQGKINGFNYANGWSIDGGILIIDHDNNIYIAGAYNYIKSSLSIVDGAFSNNVISFEDPSCSNCEKSTVSGHKYYGQDGMINGEFDNETLVASIELADSVLNSSLDFTRIDESFNQSDISLINGNYASYNGSESMAIDMGGSISGSNTDGCVYSGSITTNDANINIYSISLTYSNCATFGEYKGVGTFLKSKGSDIRYYLEVFLEKENSAFIHYKYYK